MLVCLLRVPLPRVWRRLHRHPGIDRAEAGTPLSLLPLAKQLLGRAQPVVLLLEVHLEVVQQRLGALEPAVELLLQLLLADHASLLGLLQAPVDDLGLEALPFRLGERDVELPAAAVPVMTVAVAVAVSISVWRRGAGSLVEDRRVLRRTTIGEPRDSVVVRPARVPWGETRSTTSLTGHLDYPLSLKRARRKGWLRRTRGDTPDDETGGQGPRALPQASRLPQAANRWSPTWAPPTRLLPPLFLSPPPVPPHGR